jgi:hypothetical protein
MVSLCCSDASLLTQKISVPATPCCHSNTPLLQRCHLPQRGNAHPCCPRPPPLLSRQKTPLLARRQREQEAAATDELRSSADDVAGAAFERVHALALRDRATSGLQRPSNGGGGAGVPAHLKGLDVIVDDDTPGEGQVLLEILGASARPACAEHGQAGAQCQWLGSRWSCVVFCPVQITLYSSSSDVCARLSRAPFVASATAAAPPLTLRVSPMTSVPDRRSLLLSLRFHGAAAAAVTIARAADVTCHEHWPPQPPPYCHQHPRWVLQPPLALCSVHVVAHGVAAGVGVRLPCNPRAQLPQGVAPAGSHCQLEPR